MAISINRKKLKENNLQQINNSIKITEGKKEEEICPKLIDVEIADQSLNDNLIYAL